MIDAYFWWVPMLASAESLSPAAVGGIIAAVIGGLIASGYLGKKVGETNRTHVTNDPLMVKMSEDFVTRREFEKLEIAVGLNATKMEGLFGQTMTAIAQQNATLTKTISNQNDRLTKKIEEFGSVAFRGRKDLWAAVNEQGKQVAKMEVHTDVAGKIDKLADAIASSNKGDES